jgi:quinol monooxygenase YgiN
MKPVTLINHFQIKPGRLDEFVEIQRRYATRLGEGPSAGLIGGRMYRGADNRSAVLMTQFESPEAFDSLRQSEAFKQHLKMLEPLVESSKPIFYEEAYSTGVAK